MNRTRNTNIIAAFLVLKKGNQVLLSMRKNTGYHDGDYSLVSGHVEKGETYTQAMIREAQEEAGIILDKKDLEVKHVMHRKSDTDESERVDVFFVATKWRGELINTEPDKCGGLDWFDLDKLPKNIVPCIRFALECVEKKIFYSEYGWL